MILFFFGQVVDEDPATYIWILQTPTAGGFVQSTPTSAVWTEQEVS